MGWRTLSPAQSRYSSTRRPSNSSQVYSQGVRFAGGVGVDLAGRDEKALAGPQLIPAVRAVGAGGVQGPVPGNDVMEQIVIPGKGAEGMQRHALLPAVLIQPEVQKILVGKNREGIIGHIGSPFGAECPP